MIANGKYYFDSVKLVGSDPAACKGLVIPAATAWLDAPLPVLGLSSGVWWSLLLVIRYL